MGKYSTKKYFAIGVMLPIILGGGFFGTKAISTMAFENNEANDIFFKDKIIRDIEYYGGDERYVDENADPYKSMFKKNVKYYNHFKIPKGPIIVGYDKQISDESMQQFDLAINHLNSLFEIINPKYKFRTGRFNENDCDIYVSFKPIANSKLYPNNGVGAVTKFEFNFLHFSVLKGAEIYFNSNLNLTPQQLKYYMLHEMMHVLYGSPDIDVTQSRTFSLYNYDDIAYIVTHLKNKENDSFCSLLPIDVSTLIAIYGDSSKEENKQAYLKLLHNVLEENQEHFDGKYFPQQYYEKDYQLPEYKEQEHTF